MIPGDTFVLINRLKAINFHVFSGGDEGFGMVDTPPHLASAIDALSKIPGLNMDPALLKTLPSDVG